MTRDQGFACMALDAEGFKSVPLPGDAIPGHIIMADRDGTKLMLIQGDGTVVDLLAVHAAAEDTVRNWQKYPGRKSLNVPHFVGDFGRLTKLAFALNGRKPELANPAPPPGAAS